MTGNDTLRAASVELEVPIRAPREDVWRSLVAEIGEWWPPEFYVTKSPRFVLEPRIGGCLYEDTGDGSGAIWFQVVGVVPGEWLQLQGHIAPPYGGPATSLVSLRLEDSADGTLFKLSDHLFGVIPEAACLDEGWRQIFADSFKRHAER